MDFPVEYLDYQLPQSAIAQTGIEPRDAAKMLVVHRNKFSFNAAPEEYIEHRQVKDLPDYLKPGDVVIRNRSSVVKARLIVSRLPKYGKGEVFILKIVETGIAECLIRNFGKTCIGKRFVIGNYLGEVLSKTEDESVFLVKFNSLETQEAVDINLVLNENGQTPLPPYIHNPNLEHERYETLYAKEKGSVAAPTAGLHFTPELEKNLLIKGVQIKDLILHVGLGTFKSVTVDNLAKHKMHSEEVFIPNDIVKLVEERSARIVAIGTTTVRSLETPFETYNKTINGDLYGATACFIYPPYKFRNIDVLLTNFHLPRSTLLALVMAFAANNLEADNEYKIKYGRDMVLKVYQEALSKGYRFFSLGDATLWL